MLKSKKTGETIAHSYVRIVHGGRGSYYELEREQFTAELKIAKGQEYRYEDDKWRNTVFYGWLTVGGIKVYEQFKTVDYADYKVGKFYVSIHDVKEEDMRKRIFVFGSNLAGRHGAGSARAAVEQYGAVYGVGIGLQGNSYAIPTKDHNIESLPLSEIQKYVADFLEFATEHQEMVFDVVKIGCGLAGFKEEEIMPMFSNAPDNVNLPEGWRKIMSTVHAWTDGACTVSTGRGGWAFIALYNVDGEAKEVKFSGGVDNTTNNSMELEAIYQLVSKITKPCDLIVHTDSQLVIGWLSLGWKRNEKHIDDKVASIQDILKTKGINLSFQHVKGHTGDKYNELVNKLAQEAK